MRKPFRATLGNDRLSKRKGTRKRADCADPKGADHAGVPRLLFEGHERRHHTFALRLEIGKPRRIMVNAAMNNVKTIVKVRIFVSSEFQLYPPKFP